MKNLEFEKSCSDKLAILLKVKYRIIFAIKFDKKCFCNMYLTHRIQQPIPKLFDEKQVCNYGLFLYYCVFFVITNLIGQKSSGFFGICNWIRCKIFVSRKTRFSNKCVTKLPWSVTNGFCIGFAAALLKSITKPTLFLPQSITKCKTKQRP